jgi:hypothetical protein
VINKYKYIISYGEKPQMLYSTLRYLGRASRSLGMQFTVCDVLKLKPDLNIYYKINILQPGDEAWRQDSMICLNKWSANF